MTERHPSEVFLTARTVRKALGDVYRYIHPQHRLGQRLESARRISRHVERWRLAQEYIRGRGIEIGALHMPLPVPWHARVAYVDRASAADLLREYPNLGTTELCGDIVDDGEKLTTFKAESQDFVIANHFIEHAQDPIGTIKRHLEVLRHGGVIFMAVPDRDYSFDKPRPLTSFEHLLKDHEDGPAWSYAQHVDEYVRLVEHGQPGNGLEERIALVTATGYSIHYHVWNFETLREFIEALPKRLGLPMRIKHYLHDRAMCENIVLIEKTANRST